MRLGVATSGSIPTCCAVAPLENGYIELPITSLHVMATAHLPPIHKDPFDRVLVAQAESEGALLLTSDDVVARYPGPVRRV
jgi:PIN domain nuclease of toxin-antitoxin system